MYFMFLFYEYNKLLTVNLAYNPAYNKLHDIACVV